MPPEAFWMRLAGVGFIDKPPGLKKKTPDVDVLCGQTVSPAPPFPPGFAGLPASRPVENQHLAGAWGAMTQSPKKCEGVPGGEWGTPRSIEMVLPLFSPCPSKENGG